MRGQNLIIAASLFLLGMGHVVMEMAQSSNALGQEPTPLVNVPKVSQPGSAPKKATKAKAKPSSPSFFTFSKIYPKISLGSWPPKFLQSTKSPQIQSGPIQNEK